MPALPRAKLTAAIVSLVLGGAGSGVIASQFIEEKEGLRFEAYRDSVGIWTICKGHTGDVKKGDRATPAQCDAFFKTDIARFFQIVQKANPDLPPATEAAFASFAYNIGTGAFKKSTLQRKLAAGDVKGACHEIRRWVYAGGKNCLEEGSNCKGIPQRRADEEALCLLGLGLLP